MCLYTAILPVNMVVMPLQSVYFVERTQSHWRNELPVAVYQGCVQLRVCVSELAQSSSSAFFAEIFLDGSHASIGCYQQCYRKKYVFLHQQIQLAADCAVSDVFFRHRS